MPKYAKKTDANQSEIVRDLRTIPGVTVRTDVDDILVGFRGTTYWYEIKSNDAVNRKGEVYESCKRPSQKKYAAEWKGHYRIVSSLQQILEELNIHQQ